MPHAEWVASSSRVPGMRLRYLLPPVQYIEDCGGWWLYGSRGSSRALSAQARGVLGSTLGNCWATAGLFTFLFFTSYITFKLI